MWQPPWDPRMNSACVCLRTMESDAFLTHHSFQGDACPPESQPLASQWRNHNASTLPGWIHFFSVPLVYLLMRENRGCLCIPHSLVQHLSGRHCLCNTSRDPERPQRQCAPRALDVREADHSFTGCFLETEILLSEMSIP